MNVSDAGLKFIASFEGLVNVLYNDDGQPSATSKGNCTVCVGHLVHLGPIDGRAEEAPFANGLTDDECYALMREDAARFVTAVEAHFPNVNQNQFDALVDFAYNLGPGYLKNVASVYNSGGDVCAELCKYILPAWASAALLRRRQAECALFAEPVEDEMNDEVKAAFAEVLRQQGELGRKVDGLQNLMALSLPLLAEGKTAELAALLKALGGD